MTLRGLSEDIITERTEHLRANAPNHIDFDLQLSRLTVHVIDAATGAHVVPAEVELRIAAWPDSTDDWHWPRNRNQTDDEGVRFEQLIAGRYRLDIWTRGDVYVPDPDYIELSAGTQVERTVRLEHA